MRESGSNQEEGRERAKKEMEWGRRKEQRLLWQSSWRRRRQRLGCCLRRCNDSPETLGFLFLVMASFSKGTSI